MLIVVTYDVNTESAEGRRRLARVAKHCTNFGQRVQNSVFECSLDAGQKVMFIDTLLKLIDKNSDTVRIYNLGDKYEKKIEHYGVRPGYDPKDVMTM